jgi:hypothetical protein
MMAYPRPAAIAPKPKKPIIEKVCSIQTSEYTQYA